MFLPILQPSTTATPQIRGDVTIHQSVVIADGVILNASQGTKIIIHAGACLGMGTIITAYEGNIEIKEGVILGSGSLIIGSCKIETQASLGASVTVYNANVSKRSVIPAGTVIGDTGRKVDLNEDHNQNQNDVIPSVSQSPQFDNPYSKFKISSPPLSSKSNNNLKSEKYQEKPQEVKLEPEIIEETNTELNNELEQNQAQKIEDQTANKNLKVESKDNSGEKLSTEEIAEVVNSDPWQNEEPSNKTVVGKVYINKLLFTLFPEKKN